MNIFELASGTGSRSLHTVATLFGKMDRSRHLQQQDLAESYLRSFDLKTIATEYKYEIWDVASVFGKSHGLVTLLQSQLSRIFICYRSWVEAEQLESRILEITKKDLGESHPGTLSSIASLAKIYQGQERWNEAEELELRVIESRRIALGPEHPDTVSTMTELVVSYSHQGRWKEAEQLQTRVLDIKYRTLGPEHPDVRRSQDVFAEICSNQQKNTEGANAESALNCIQIFQNIRG